MASSSTNSLLNRLHHGTHEGSGRRRRTTRSVELHDSFPCESAADELHDGPEQQQQQHPELLPGRMIPTTTTELSGDDAREEHPFSPTPSFASGVVTGRIDDHTKSNDAGSELLQPSSGTRGGGGVMRNMQSCQRTNEASSIILSNDELLDQFVEELINAEYSNESSDGEEEEAEDDDELDQDETVDGEGKDVNTNNGVSISDTTGAASSVIQWIRTRIISIFQSFLAMLRKIHQFSIMQQQRNCYAKPGVRVRLKRRKNRIMNDGSRASQNIKRSLFPASIHPSHHCRRSTFENHASAQLRRRFSLQLSMKNNAATSTKRGASNLLSTKRSSGITPRIPVDQGTSRPNDITELRSQLTQRKSSSILFSAEKTKMMAPPMQLLNKVRGRLENSSEGE